MADVSYLITQGIGTPSGIPWIITDGLGIGLFTPTVNFHGLTRSLNFTAEERRADFTAHDRSFSWKDEDA